MPTLSGVNTVATGTETYTLDSPVRTDWAHFTSTWTVPNRKSGGGSTIGLPTTVGTGTLTKDIFSGIGYTISWTGGTPTASASKTEGIIVTPGTPAAGQGWTLDIPIDANSRAIEVYWGTYSAPGRLVAHVSDASSTDYTLNTTGNASNPANFKTVITCQAAGSATLTLTGTITGVLAAEGSAWLEAIAYITTIVSSGPTLPWDLDNEAWDDDKGPWDTENIGAPFALGLKLLSGVRANYALTSPALRIGLGKVASVKATSRVGAQSALGLATVVDRLRTTSRSGTVALGLSSTGGIARLTYRSATCRVGLGISPGAAFAFLLSGVMGVRLGLGAAAGLRYQVTGSSRVGLGAGALVKSNFGLAGNFSIILNQGSDTQASYVLDSNFSLALSVKALGRYFPWDTDLPQTANQWSVLNGPSDESWYVVRSDGAAGSWTTVGDPGTQS